MSVGNSRVDKFPEIQMSTMGSLDSKGNTLAINSPPAPPNKEEIQESLKRVKEAQQNRHKGLLRLNGGAEFEKGVGRALFAIVTCGVSLLIERGIYKLNKFIQASSFTKTEEGYKKDVAILKEAAQTLPEYSDNIRVVIPMTSGS